MYLISFVWLYYGWYRLYKQTKFHWFDDRREWNQMDKAGHIFGAYFETVWAYELLRWGGMDNKRSAVTAAFLGMGFQSINEVWDGFTQKWGASWSDLLANFIGASFAMTQFLLWEEQRILCKYSFAPYKHKEGELAERADNLFGKTMMERAIKDYNGMTFWLSVNPSKFIPRIKPDWLCYSVGYGTENVYGGFENKWLDKEGKEHNRNDLTRYRLLKFSLDADLPRMRKKDPTGKVLFKASNPFKMPFPSYKIRF
ncbi:MAG: DUF2279 domain-containing protein [Bacteroidetes bacterium]|nr:DUF2279 domain-containing protein [Bacteroidota bacterium]